MAGGGFFKTLFDTLSWVGQKGSRYGDTRDATELPTIDNAVQGEYFVDTTVDCYVTGTYIDQRGNVIEVKQRYSVHIRYSKSTHQEVMQELRAKLLDAFNQKYSSQGFNVTDVFVPSLLVPRAPEDAEEYKGRTYWKMMTRMQMRDDEMRVAKTVYRSRIKGIINRYSIRHGDDT